MARSSVVVVNILVKLNHYCRNNKRLILDWRAGPLRRRKGQLEGFVKGDRRDFLVGLGHASRATVGGIKGTDSQKYQRE
jgi:hypothetical protein